MTILEITLRTVPGTVQEVVQKVTSRAFWMTILGLFFGVICGPIQRGTLVWAVAVIVGSIFLAILNAILHAILGAILGGIFRRVFRVILAVTSIVICGKRRR